MAEVVQDHTPANDREAVCRLVVGLTLCCKLGPTLSPRDNNYALDFQQKIAHNIYASAASMSL
jgi:hypothetical protein